ncbi:MAG: hypothetical protein LAT54_02855, partial [Cryomorphaceae bacterium]|nr:hypothetical protein [Cryomorphaceae bacterium]
RMASNFRNIYARLAEQLINEGQNEKALEVLDRVMEEMPEHSYPYNFFILNIIEGYYKAGNKEKGRELANTYADRLEGELKYYNQFKGSKRKAIDQERGQANNYFQYLVNISVQYDGDRNNLQENEIFQRYQSVSR